MPSEFKIDIGLSDLQKGVKALEQMERLSDEIAENLKLEKTESGLVARVDDLKKVSKETERLRANTEKLKNTDEEALKNNIRAREVLNARKKSIREVVRAEQGLLSIYQKESKRLNDLRKEYKDLALQNKDNTKQSRALLREITKLDTKLKAVDKTVGQSQRNVGNYASAFRGAGVGVGRFALQLAGIGAGVAVVSSIMNRAARTVIDFDESIADLRKTTGLTKQGATELADELLKINTKTSVTEILALASAGGRLGLQGPELVEFTRSVDTAFVALGDSLEGEAEDIGLTLGKLASNFDLDKKFGIGEAINKVGSSLNELGANSKATEGPIVDFTQRLAGVAIQAGIGLPNIQALGALIDETGQSVEVGATTFNKLLPAIGKDVERFAEVAGINVADFKKIVEEDAFEALKLVAEGARSNEKGLVGLSEVLENYGIDSARAAGVVGVLSDNTERLTELQEIANGAFDDGTSVIDEFNIKNNTLTARLAKSGKAFDRLVLGLDAGDGFISSLIGGVADLGTGFFRLLTPMTKTSEQLQEQQIEMNILVSRITDTNVKEEERRQLIIKLNKEYPELLKNLDQEKLSNEDLTEALRDFNFETTKRIALELEKEDLIAAIIKRREADAKLAKLEGNLQRDLFNLAKARNILDELQNKTLSEQIELVSNSAGGLGKLTRQLGNLENTRQASIRAQDEEAAATTKLSELIATLGITRDEEIESIIDEGEALDETTKAIKTAEDAFERLKRLISETTKELKAQSVAGEPNEKSLARLEELTTQLEEAQDRLNIALGKEPEALKNIRQDREKAGKENIEITDREIKAKQGLRKDELSDIIANEKSTEAARIQAVEDLRDSVIENTNLTESERLKIIRDSEKQITAIKEEEAEKRKIQDEEERARLLENVDIALNTVAEIANSVGGILSGIREREIQDIDAQAKAEEESLQQKLDNNLITEEEFEEQKTAIEEEAEAERNIIRKKQAETDKALAIFGALIDGARSVVAALTVPPPNGPILAAINAGIAAAQVAAIIAQPIPQFAEGTAFLDDPRAAKGKDTILMKGDRGEGIIPAKRNKQYDGLSQAMIDGRVTDWIMNSDLISQATDRKEIAFTENLARNMMLNADFNDVNMVDGMTRIREDNKKNTELLVSAFKSRRRVNLRRPN